MNRFVWMGFLLIGFVAGLLGLPSTVWSAEVRPVVLYFFIEDGQAFTKEGRQVMVDFFRETMPGHRLALIQARDGRYFSNDAKVRAQLQGQFQEALRPGGEITHLVIATHGGTEGREGDRSSSLRSFGRFNQRGLDRDLAEILKPLEGRVSKTAHVVLDACSTMCGTSPEARARAQAFMNSLGATEGVLYGAVTPEIGLDKMGAQGRTWEKLKPQWHLVRNLALISAALSLPYGWWGVEAMGAQDLLLERARFTVVSAGLLTFMFQYLQPLFVWFYEKSKSVNQGHLYFMKQGRVLHREAIEKRVESLTQIYFARSCKKALL